MSKRQHPNQCPRCGGHWETPPKSPTARAERAVLRVVMAPILDMDRLNKACRRLLAAKAKARPVLFSAAARFPGSVLATSTKAKARAKR